MFGIFNLAVNINFSLLENDSDAEDYERTCTMGILTISRVFILQRNDLQNCNKIEKQLTLNHLYQPVFLPMKSQYYIPGSTM